MPHLTDIDIEILKRGGRRNFWLFCLYYDYEFFDKRRFLKPVALAFQKLVDEYRTGKAISISVSMPPRAGKSYITSLFAAYWLGQFPELSVMRNSCTGTLYQKFSYDTRNIVKNEKYRSVFGVELASDKQNLDGWNLSTSKQVGYFGAGVGGTIIGFGANLAITDDLYKSMQDALSTTTNSFVKMWKQSAHDSRKEKNCPEIFIGTRWAKDDIIGEAIDSNRIDIQIQIPALTENDTSFCEDVKSTDEYLKIKSEIEPMVWLAEYMQDPTNPEGLLLPISSLSFSQIPETNIILRFAVADPADKGGDKFSIAFVYVVEFEGKIKCYLVDAIHSTDGIQVNSDRVIERLHTHKIETLLVESNGVGLAAVLLLKDKMPEFCQLSPFNSKVQKETRILSNYEFVQKYFVFDENYQANKEYKSFITDLTSYTKEGDNKHKADAIDVICSAAYYIKLRFSELIYR